MKDKTRVRILFWGSICLLLSIILVFHIYEDTKKIVAPPSSVWSRPVALGQAVTASPPILEEVKGQLQLVTVRADGIVKQSLDFSGHPSAQKVIELPSVETSNILEYSGSDTRFLFKERNQLKFTDLTENKPSITALNPFFGGEPHAYAMVKDGSYDVLLGSLDKSLTLLKFKNFEVNYKNIIPTQHIIEKISCVKINKDMTAVALVSKTGLDAYILELYGLNNNLDLKPLAKPFAFTTQSFVSSGTESVRGLNLIYNEQELWISYETGIQTARNLKGRVFITHFKPDFESTLSTLPESTFKPLSINGYENANLVFSDFTFIESREASKQNAFVCVSGVDSDQMTVYEVDLNDEKTGDPTVVSYTNGWHRYVNSTYMGDGLGVVYLEVQGGQTYNLLFSGNSELLKSTLNKTTWQDIQLATANLMIYLIVAVMLMALNFPYFIVLAFLLFFLQASSEQFIKTYRMILFYIVLVLHLVVKYFVFTRMLGQNLSQELPALLSYGPSYPTVILSISLLSFGILFIREGKPQEDSIAAYYFKALVLDLFVTFMLVGPYVFEKF